MAYKDLSRLYDSVIVEGLGGLLVPIKRDYFVLDLARDFGLPLVVVTRLDLGTLNRIIDGKHCVIERSEVKS